MFPSDFPEQTSETSVDIRYPTRDLLGDGSGEHRVYAAATAIYLQRVYLPTREDFILNQLKSWSKVISGEVVLSLQYDRSWLAPDLPLMWLKAYNLLRGSGEGKWFQLLFSLPAMAYTSPELGYLVSAFVAFAVDPRFHFENPPHYGTFDLSKGYQPSLTTLHKYLSDCAYAFEHSPENSAPAEVGESAKKLRKRRKKLFDDRLKLHADKIAHQLLKAWPCEIPPGCPLDPVLYDVAKFTSHVQELFANCHDNIRLKEHLSHIQKLLNDTHSQLPPMLDAWYSFDPSTRTSTSVPWSLTMDQLFARPAPLLPRRRKLPRSTTINVVDSPISGSTPLHHLIATAEANALNEFQRQYVSTLHVSAERFASEALQVLGATELMKLPGVEILEVHYTRCSARFIEGLQNLRRYLGPRNESEYALEQAGQWPRVTAYTLFRCLASNSRIVPSDNWKVCLMRLALLALELQRARRLLRLHVNNLHEELRKELENEGCDGWSPEVHPDWLLVQLQGNFLVRRVQAEVANEMISPRSGGNTAMQLNMGEGKSSVIVPIVSADLADGNQLVRVIVPKALTTQMFHLLADRLGGLVNKRIYFLPFSRLLQADLQKVGLLHEIMSDCMIGRGILIAQPEHVLSLRLVSVEKQLLHYQGQDTQLALSLMNLQRWLYSHSRDILDESDEVLHVRYQLVYTIGLQKHMEGFPERWTTTQQVLGLVSKHASSLRELFPLGVEYEGGPSGSFPHLRILHAEPGHRLVSWIAQDIIDGLLPNINFGQLRPHIRKAIRIFISCEKVPPKKLRLVQVHSQGTPLWGGLLLLRGLLTTGILLYPFRERRWRVDYGLAPARTTLAVPYRAKDVPAQRAEFGHPDVAIIFTCLSYYYTGLSEDQLRLSFEILLKQDDPTLDYDLWVQDCLGVPESLRTLSGINIKSSEQWNTFMLPLFSRNRTTINFYLSSVVFPKEAKEFPAKLSCSGWDLAEKKERLLTGLSGTNDGQYLFPLHITQHDADHQKGTNAKVLSCLLQPENNHYKCMAHENGERRTTHEFLRLLVAQNPEIRVLLDVGAQMLDLQNHELAKAWLNNNPNVSAAIYFNEDDELTVSTQDGTTQLLLSSPFAQQLDQCVVYLDDAHTRGTDIKFPTGFRAAVTLGPKVTKDRLTQGCMRMRKLGQGHSIMFFAPLEVDRRIRTVAGKDCLDPIGTMDILHWAIHETCEEIQQRVPHWVQQGIDHTTRYGAWTHFCENLLSAEALSARWLQLEAKSLEELYAPHEASNPTLLSTVPEIRQRCLELGVLSLRDVRMDEEQEQEREAIHEAEHERQVERPPRAQPAVHWVHPHVVAFVKTGIIPADTDAFYPVFQTLHATSAVTDEAHVWSPFVLATADFLTTVSSSETLDDYLRPVQWVVSVKMDHHEALVILSPYEANQLISFIRSSKNVCLHLYTPRITKSMKPCDDLALYSIPMVPAGWMPPSSLMDQLNVFAGQLYLTDYETYIRLCRFLHVYTSDLRGTKGIKVSYDGFIKKRGPHLRTNGITFQSSPMNFLRTLMNIRRKGMRFTSTHMGKLFDGRLLSEKDFDDSDHNGVVQ